MPFLPRNSLSHLLLLTLVLMTLAGCSTASVGPGGRVTKVKYYHLVPDQRLRDVDPALQMERDYHLFGAVTKAEIMARGGHYYSVFWEADDRSQPVTVRFEYRQANTGLTAKTKEQVVSDVGRRNLSRFQVTGDEYAADGRVTAWRVTLRRGNDVLASQESFLWN